MPIPPLFTSPVAQIDPTKFGPAKWNTVTALLTALLDGVDANGTVLTRSSASSTGAAWTASPTLAGLTLGTPLAATSGGTGFASFAVGDIPYASTTTALAKLASVAAGSVLVPGGIGAAPAWSATPTLTDLTLTGILKAANGLVGAPSYTFTSDPTTGIYRPVATSLGFAIGGILSFYVDQNRTGFPSGMQVGWSSSGSAGGSMDTSLYRDGAAGVLALRTGTAAQVLRVYNTYTDGSNYERGAIGWVSNVLRIGAEKAGTGGSRVVDFIAPGGFNFRVGGSETLVWAVNSAGHLVNAGADNTYDIGASGGTRPRDIYLAGNLRAGGFVHVQGSAGLLLTAGVGLARITGVTDGILTLSDNASTSFVRLNFGAATDACPALARSGTDVSLIGGAAGVVNSSLVIPSQKATTGQRYLQIDANGRITSSATAPVGT